MGARGNLTTSPARNNLPEPSLSTEHEELQQAWQSFIKEREQAVEVQTVRLQMPKENETSANPKPQTEAQTEEQADEAPWQSKLHIYTSEETVKRFRTGYSADRNFKALVNRSCTEGFDEKKYRAYRIGTNGLLYFEDTDSRIRLCVPEVECNELLKEVHNGPHKSAHAGWERTLTALREHFYWPGMRTDVIKYVRTCDPCQKIKHS